MKMIYKIKNGEKVVASNATAFVTALRTGSYYGDTGDNESYKIKFAERFEIVTGKKIECPTHDDVAFVNELVRLKFITDITTE